MSADCGFAHDDAAYVLGALAPVERLAFERHLTACVECTRSVGGLAGLPSLLARVPREVLEPALTPDPVSAPGPVPETLLPALIREARRGERRRRRLLGLAAAAAIVAIATASAVAVGGLGRDGAEPRAVPSSPVSTAPAQPMTPLGADGDAASVALTSVAWGTRLDLECRWAADGEPGYGHEDGAGSYALVIRSTDGEAQQVATWRALPGRTMRVTGATSLDRDEIAAVEVRAADGRRAFELATDRSG